MAAVGERQQHEPRRWAEHLGAVPDPRLLRRMIADKACCRRGRHRPDLPCVAQRVHPRTAEPTRRRPTRRMLVQASLEDTDSA
jgi:hypothetical protein